MNTEKKHKSVAKGEVAKSDLPYRPQIIRTVSHIDVPVIFGEDAFNDVNLIVNMVLVLFLQGQLLAKDVRFPKDEFLEKRGVLNSRVEYVFSKRAYKVSFIWQGLKVGTYVMMAHYQSFNQFVENPRYTK